jgi:RNA polymerase sigma factor (sigma-70 family)
MIEGFHKTYGRVKLDEKELATDHPMIQVRLLNSRGQFEKQRNILTVGKAALVDCGGYKPKHRDKPLAEMYLPLAMSIAAKMRRGNDEYEELVSIASVALVRAAEKHNKRSPVHFSVFARQVVENAIKDHWRVSARKLEDANGFNFDEIGLPVGRDGDDRMIKITRLVGNLRPRLRQLVTRMYLQPHPALAKELAYEWNISEVRISQLKQEATLLLREMLKKN